MADVAVQFVVGGFPHPLTLSRDSTLSDALVRLAGELSLPPSDLSASLNGTELDPAKTLGEQLDPSAASVAIEVTVRGGDAGDEAGGAEAGTVVGDPDYRMPDVIEVVVQHDPSLPPKRIRVELVRAPRPKRYEGGYRNRKTGAVYHHASSQANLESRKPYDGPERFHREAQTAYITSRTQQTQREHGTQMQRADLSIDDSRDYEITVRDTYFSAEELAKLKAEKTLVMQCHWRGYKARVRAQQLRELQARRKEEIREMEVKKAEDASKQHKREIERRMHPRSFEDFEILYNELENWRTHEQERINAAGMDNDERLAALAQLLHKETKLLQTIDRLKISANDENRQSRINHMLSLMAAPKKWQLADGNVSEVHTPFTTRAKELLELYRGLNLPMLTVDERLDVLLHVKWTVKEFDCNLTRDIVDLIDREADLLNRGRKEKSLEGLRKRTSNLFLQFIETPEFNPEAARFQKVPRDFLMRPNVRPISDAAAH